MSIEKQQKRMSILRTSYFFSHSSRSCSSLCACLSKCSALTSTCLNLHTVTQSVISLSSLDATDGQTHFSVTSFECFSAVSSSSSNNATFLCNASTLLLFDSASSVAVLLSWTLPSSLSSSPSLISSWCLSDRISCSWVRSCCSRVLFFASDSSARATASSASLRRDARRYVGVVSTKRVCFSTNSLVYLDQSREHSPP